MSTLCVCSRGGHRLSVYSRSFLLGLPKTLLSAPPRVLANHYLLFFGEVVLSYHGEEVTWPKLVVYGNEHSVHSSVHPGVGGHGISHRSHDREPDFRPQL